MHRHPDLIGAHRQVAASLARKCEHAGISVPDIDTIQSSPFREEIEREWKNMLRVEVDYRAENGRQGPRRVEPYSLRRTRDGNLVLFVVNDRGQLCSYRIDRIAHVRPTTETFTPRYQVEF
jgi:predicted DNA-binding transcriptional regulator YafY